MRESICPFLVQLEERLAGHSVCLRVDPMKKPFKIKRPMTGPAMQRAPCVRGLIEPASRVFKSVYSSREALAIS